MYDDGTTIIVLTNASPINMSEVVHNVYLAAHGLETVSARPLDGAIEVLQGLVTEYNVREVVVGLPLNMDGTSGASAEAVRGIAQRLDEALPVRVRLVDERMTTAQAERVLLEGSVTRRKRRDVRDKLAAVLILQSFLDGRVRES